MRDQYVKRNPCGHRKVEGISKWSFSPAQAVKAVACLALVAICVFRAENPGICPAQCPETARIAQGSLQRADLVGDIIDIIDDLLGGDEEDKDTNGGTPSTSP